ncbi:MAG: hypothetical protein MUE73_05555 [Planctomycetes bacterium]|jgi:hypothetical protein|nr:hypothetical protein [Planctomycetota bacterium]
MELSREHIDPRCGRLPGEKLAFLGRAETLDARLRPILGSELAAGNLIFEVRWGAPGADDDAGREE